MSNRLFSWHGRILVLEMIVVRRIVGCGQTRVQTQHSMDRKMKAKNTEYTYIIIKHTLSILGPTLGH